MGAMADLFPHTVSDVSEPPPREDAPLADRAAEAGQRTLLFVDEIHRFNRAQQDGFLPFVERGTVTLVGATTENPSFALNAALLSRAQVLILHRLGAEALGQLLDRAETLEGPLPVTDPARDALIASADGDGRFLLNQAETLYHAQLDQPLGPAELGRFLQRRVAVYDKDRDGHYNLISALHKAVRGSDPQASLYYLARMLTAGEEPRFLARRLVRMAVEDIGLADPQALTQCMAAKDAYEFLGSPEGELALAQACLYLATAPKSNAVYKAQKAAWKSAKETGSLMPPPNILNAPTKLMKEIGYGAGYSYDHNSEEGFSGDDYWPEEMEPQSYYEPVERGFEREIASGWTIGTSCGAPAGEPVRSFSRHRLVGRQGRTPQGHRAGAGRCARRAAGSGREQKGLEPSRGARHSARRSAARYADRPRSRHRGTGGAAARRV